MKNIKVTLTAIFGGMLITLGLSYLFGPTLSSSSFGLIAILMGLWLIKVSTQRERSVHAAFRNACNELKEMRGY